MSRRAIYTLVAAVVAFIVILLAIDKYRSSEQAMSEAPERTGSELIIQPTESVVLAEASLSYADVQSQMASLAAAMSGSESDSESLCVDLLLTDACVRANWELYYRLDGPIRVGRQGERVRIDIPAKFSGNAGFSGAIADALGLDSKNFSGSFRVWVDATVVLAENFCPVLQAGNPGFRWTDEASIELIGSGRVFGERIPGLDIDVGDYFTDDIRSALNDAIQDVKIPCDPIRNQLAEIWKVQVLPLDLPDLPQLYVNIVPAALSASGLIVEDAGIRLRTRMTANVQVAPEPADTDVILKLPKNTPVGDDAPNISLNIPLMLPYETLSEGVMKAVGGEPIVIEAEDRTIEVTVREVEIYPSNDRVAVSVGFSADLPWRIFDAQGRLWLTGVPTLSENGLTVFLADPTLTRQLNNPLWSVVSLVMSDQIRGEIAQAAVHDLTEDANAAIKEIVDAVANVDPEGRIQMSLTFPELKLGGIVLTEPAIALIALFKAGLDIRLAAPI